MPTLNSRAVRPSRWRIISRRLEYYGFSETNWQDRHWHIGRTTRLS